MASILDLPSGIPAANTPDIVTPTPTSEELEEMASRAVTLDQGKGFMLNQLRVFYPRVGWNILFSRVEALVAAGRLRKRFTPGATRNSGWDVYTVI